MLETKSHQGLFSYESLAGQDQAKRVLQAAAGSGRLAHAWLLHGERGLGMELAAMALARTVLCQQQGAEACDACPACLKSARLDHPDLQILFPLAPAANKGSSDAEARNPAEQNPAAYRAALDEWLKQPLITPRVSDARQIYVEQVRYLKHWASRKSFEGSWRVCLILEAEKLGIQAQNALLKLLEEPPENMLLVLCSSRPQALLPTIHSRCQQLRFRNVPQAQLQAWLSSRQDIAEADPILISQMAGGNPGHALELLQQDDETGSGPDGTPLEERQPDWTCSDFMRRLLLRKPIALYRTIMMMEESRDREGIGRFLESLQQWLQDVELVQELGPEESASRLRRPMDRAAIEGFASAFHLKDNEQVQEELMLAGRRLSSNVHIFSVLTVLCQQLKRSIALNDKP